MALKKILAAVLTIHCGLIIWAISSPTLLKEKKKEMRLTVKTLTILPAPQHAPAVFSPAAPRAPAPKPKAPAPLKTAAPPPAKKQKAAEKKAAPPPLPSKEAVRPQSKVPQHLLRELEETIAKIDEKRDKLYTSRKPHPAQKLKPLELEIDRQIDYEVKVEEVNYRETLVSYLHQTLNLPDYGEVKIEVTLLKNGSVERLKVLKSESEKNKRYLETHLPVLKFPPVAASSKEKEFTFVLTFCNEL